MAKRLTEPYTIAEPSGAYPWEVCWVVHHVGVARLYACLSGERRVGVGRRVHECFSEVRQVVYEACRGRGIRAGSARDPMGIRVCFAGIRRAEHPELCAKHRGSANTELPLYNIKGCDEHIFGASTRPPDHPRHVLEFYLRGAPRPPCPATSVSPARTLHRVASPPPRVSTLRRADIELYLWMMSCVWRPGARGPGQFPCQQRLAVANA